MRFIGLDPSTKTGFVALDESGQILRAKELTGIGDKDPLCMITLIDEVMAHTQKGDMIVMRALKNLRFHKSEPFSDKNKALFVRF